MPLPILHGSLKAGIAYLLFMSEMLSGIEGSDLINTNWFLDFKALTVEEKSLPLIKQFMIIQPTGIQETSKLLVWCFIAGYSERFITGILDQMQNQTLGSE